MSEGVKRKFDDSLSLLTAVTTALAYIDDILMIPLNFPFLCTS